MNKSVVSRGKSIQDAVTTALNLLNAAQTDVDIEIIKPEKRGILGIGAKPAIVRVTRTPQATKVSERISGWDSLQQAINSMDNPNEIESSFTIIKATNEKDTDLSGKVWVKDGQIYCKDASDQYPLVSPAKGLTLYKNDVVVKETVIIGEQDVFRVDLQDEKLEPSWEIKMSDDKMEATLSVTPGKCIFRRLKDKAPSSFVQLEIEEKKIPVILEANLVMNKLQELGIVHGVDYSELARACTTDQSGIFIIARGTSPTPGKNGYFLPMQEMEIKKGLKEQSNGKVDYREVQEFPSVERGQVIGAVCPPDPGYPGLTVTEETVQPTEVFPLSLTAGKGAAIVEDGTKAIATQSGHPEVKIQGHTAIITVVPKLMIGKNVDLQTGNIHYIGDIEILGSVQDGMTVEAQGNILVHQNINMARISGNFIIVKKNIISSEVSAGKSHLLLAEISLLLPEMMENMKQMIRAIRQLSAVPAFKVSSFTRTGLGPIIKILCEGKFKSFPASVMNMIEKIQSGSHLLGEQWAAFGDQLDKGFVRLHASNLKSVDDVMNLLQTAGELYSSIQDSREEGSCFLKADFVHNSQIYTSGDIFVTGQGVYQSKLHAGGFIEINGYIRGGEIYGAGGVQIGEAGTRGGMVTQISVPQNAAIKIKSAMEGTVIYVGKKSHKFTLDTPNVFARLDNQGQLITA